MNTLEVEQFSWDELFSQVRRFSLLVLEPRGMSFVLQVEGRVPRAEPDIPETLSLFRIVKEAVTNAAKHSHAARVEVCFAFEEERLTLSVRDDGKWAEERSGGRGLRHINKRVQGLKGEFILEKKPETRLLCRFPLPLNLHVAERGDA